ncbi:contractile injection system tape measure protein, partial [Trinickia sp.]|uniref:contractile injection system tape measure protein n=1 Tax=Trinickia sp. TaxID=2571163 RepID=UPI002D7E1BD2
MSANHRIDELLFDIAFASFTPEMMHTDAIRALVVDTLLPVLDREFDQYSDDDFILRIDSLEINVGNVTEAELPAALAESLKKAFEQTLQHGSASSPTARPIPRSRDDVQKLLTFLADGLMPWTPDVRAQAVHEQLLERILRQGVDTFLPALRTSPVRGVLLARLVRQFPVEQLWALLRQLAAQHADVLMARFDALQALLQEAALDRATATTAMHAAWESLLTIYMEPHASLPTFVALLKPAVAAIAA